MIPAIIPESGGAPEANAIPKHNGRATKNTTIPDGKFSFIPPNTLFAFFIFFEKYYCIFLMKILTVLF